MDHPPKKPTTARRLLVPCFHPLDARRSPGGTIGFKPMTPFDTLLKLPCGRCIGCKIERSRQWAVRGTHEQKQHRSSCFLTLTIANAAIRPQDSDAFCAHQDMCTEAKSAAQLPTAREMALDFATQSRARNHAVDNCAARTVRVPYANGTRDRPSLACPEGTGPSLAIRDHQLFVKRLIRRLRDQGPIEPIRFMMCGEYGEKKGRPHYHYILFGYDFPDKRPTKKRNGHQCYRSSLLEQLWPHGHSEIGECNFDTIAYVARYVTKKITGAAADDHYKRQLPNGTNYWLQPEFNAMSRGGQAGRGGIGKNWINKYQTSVYPHDRVISKGKRAKPPRYYDQQLEKTDPVMYDQVKAAREAANNTTNPANKTPERLRAGEAILHASLTTKKRPLE